MLFVDKFMQIYKVISPISDKTGGLLAVAFCVLVP